MAPVGRPSWTTPEQYDFLEGYVSRLNAEKQGNGLKPFYDQVAAEFKLRWRAEPTAKEKLTSGDPTQWQGIADARQVNVCRYFNLPSRSEG